ncbi:MAG: M20/M25/M40 family metallo-hydrolase [Bacteroidia bacterium]|nr:M20/M25/M40 family metallo-hydrolase [Bacteroidia bacterium]
MEKINQYIAENQDRFLEELFALIRIPSISSLKENRPDMDRAAAYWVKILTEAGVDRAEIFQTPGNPVVFAEKIIDPLLPTVLVYAHMDVMPVDPIELWDSNPFEPVIRDGKIWARGADDDKGQSFIQAKAFEYLVKTNTYIILVSDTGIIARDIPSVTVGLRGLAYLQVEVTGPNRDLHSGLFGGAVANPLSELCKMIAQVTDENHHITVPDFYDKVQEVSSAERAMLAEAPFDLPSYRESIGVKQEQGEKGFSSMERVGIRPAFDVCGIWGGYTGEGAKTVLPSKAYAKISARLVPGQDYHEISDLLSDYFKSIAPDSVSVKITYLHGGPGYVCPIDLPAYRAAEAAYTDVYGIRPVPVRSGGSIPIISAFEEILGAKTILMGFGLESDAIHSPNENFPLENLFNGIRTTIRFYHHFLK